MLMEHPIRYRPLRAPQADRQALIEPPLRLSGDSLAMNRARIARAANIEIAGHPLSHLREMAQHDLLQAARQYTSSYRNLPSESHRLESTNTSTSLVLAGHQPELFHPGVWFKNFALSYMPECPVVPITPETLEARLESLVCDRAALARAGAAGPAWVLAHHDPRNILKRILWLHDLARNGQRYGGDPEEHML